MKKIGLVFAGGGGKGAYHIGVWRALRQTGLDQWVAAVSGTSVGGLNAALFLQGDLEIAEEIWKQISKEKILTPKRGFPKPEYHDHMHLYLRDGLLEIIRNHLDMSVFDKSSRNCYLACVRTFYQKDWDSYVQMTTCPGGTKEYQKYVNGKATYFNMRSFSYEDREGILLATSAIPFIFPREKIGGYYYMDGCMADNVPIEPLYRLEHCGIIVAVHLDCNKGTLDHKLFPNAKILEVRPTQDLGGVFSGVLNFNAEDAVRKMRQGYEDTITVFDKIAQSASMERDAARQWEDAAGREALAVQRMQQGRANIQKMLDRWDDGRS